MTNSDTRMLEGRVAIVTGSSRGIGEAIVNEFAHQGAAVVVHGRNEGAVANVVAAIRADGGEAMCVTGDVTDFGQIEAVSYTHLDVYKRQGPTTSHFLGVQALPSSTTSWP